MGSELPGRDSRYILGVNTGFHDGSAALLRDGELVAMVEQERLSRVKRATHELPNQAIAMCLEQEGFDLRAVSELAVGWDVPSVIDMLKIDFDETEFVDRLLRDIPGSGRLSIPVRYVPHHIAHAASAFYTSGWEEAAILVADGRGESDATTLAVGGSKGIEVLKAGACICRWDISTVALLPGSASDIATEESSWGLAAYGCPSQQVPLSASEDGYAITVAPDVSSPTQRDMKRLGSSLRESFRSHNYPFEPGQSADVMAYANFAASIQGALEEAILSLATVARRESALPRLALAGGVALNCSANGALVQSGIFDEIWIPPFPHDAGVSLGAALVADRANDDTRAAQPRLPHAFWAPDTGPPSASTLAMLDGCEANHYNEPQLVETTARHLEEGKLVAWWQGRAEVGQRALGARSILCDPRKREVIVRANAAKGREAWRPLAPAVLTDHANKVFDGSLPAASDYMLAALPVLEKAQPQIPAAVHVDGSARPQIVRKDQRRYHGVISAFHERTGVPAVINTSFNLALTGPRSSVHPV